MRFRSVLVVALVAAMVETVPAPGWAADGDLDPSFGTNGVVVTDLGANDSSTAVAVQRDGKIVAAGMAENFHDFGLVRYNADGSLDLTFGTGGTVVSDFGSANDQAHAMAIQNDGKIVVAGGNGVEVLVARYDPDGALDSSFASGAVTPGAARGLVVQKDGKIVVVGADLAGALNKVLVLRLLSDGTLDPVFGSSGRVVTPFAGANGWAMAVAIDADGKIVVAGGHFIPQAGCAPHDPCDTSFAVVRYNGDGSLDPSFGVAGVAVTGRPGETNSAYGIVIQPDGKIVVAGDRDTRPVAPSDFLLVRYNRDGSLDPTFGSGGEVVTDFGAQDGAEAVALQSDGRIVAAGHGAMGGPTGDPLTVPVDFAIARYHPDGTLDHSFGAGGKVLIDTGDHGSAAALAVEPRGRIVASGTVSSPLQDFALVRLVGTPPPPGEPVGVVNPNDAMWYLRSRWGAVTSFLFGNPGDKPFLGDWDCDGIDTPGIYRPSTESVYLRNTNTEGIADIRFLIGDSGDVPLAGDFDGDGCDTVSMFRPAEGSLYIFNRLGHSEGAAGAADTTFAFGGPGDKPVVGDFDADGVETVGFHQPSTGRFYWRNTLSAGDADADADADAELYFGDPGDVFLAGDWGVVDGLDTPAVIRSAEALFYFRDTLTDGVADSRMALGDPGWIPVAGTFGLP